MNKSICIAMLLVIISGCTRQKKIVLLTAQDPTISLRLLFHVGSQCDPAGKEGIAYLTAHMLADASTMKNSYDQILKKLYPMAAGYSAQVDKEMTVIEGRVHKDNWQEYYTLFKEAILQPAFKEEDFKRIQSETLNYLENTLRYADNEELGKEALNQYIFTGTAYGHPEQGLIPSIKKLTVEEIKDFYASRYTFPNLTIGLGGHVDEKLATALQEDFMALPQSRPPQSPIPIAPAIQGFEVLLIEKDTESTAISLGFPIELLRDDADFFAMWLANSYFGEHRKSSSHLYQVIRETRGMNYGDYSYIEAFPHSSAHQFPPPNVARRKQIFQIWIRPVPNAVRHFALRAALRELQKLIDQGLDQEQFELTQKFLSKYYLQFAPTTSYRLGYRLDDEFYGIDNFLQIFPQNINSLTLDEVNAALKRNLQYHNIKIVMVTKDAEQFKKDLMENRPSPVVYKTAKPQNILDEDKEIENYPLPITADKVKIVKVEDMLL